MAEGKCSHHDTNAALPLPICGVCPPSQTHRFHSCSTSSSSALWPLHQKARGDKNVSSPEIRDILLQLTQCFPQVLLRMGCSIRFHRRPRFHGRVDYKMTLNNCSSLDLEAHLKGRRKYKRNLRTSTELRLKTKASFWKLSKSPDIFFFKFTCLTPLNGPQLTNSQMSYSYNLALFCFGAYRHLKQRCKA